MNKSILSSVVRAMSILKLFNHKQKEFSFMEIVHNTKLPKSTAHRLIQSLKNEGFLSQNPSNNNYRLGIDILGLGGVVSTRHSLYSESLPLLKKLTQAINESTHICVIENKEVTYLSRVESDHPDNLITQIGKKNPIHSTSEGLCILAYQSDNFIKRTLDNYLYAYTDKTLTTFEDIKWKLERIKKDGYYVAEETYFKEYTGIAAPIKNHMGEVVSSLSIIGKTNRLKQHNIYEITKKIIDCAKKISESLGYYT